MRLRWTDRTNLDDFDCGAIDDALSYISASDAVVRAAARARRACEFFVGAFDGRRPTLSRRADRIARRRQRAETLTAELERLVADAPDSWVSQLLSLETNDARTRR